MGKLENLRRLSSIALVPEFYKWEGEYKDIYSQHVIVRSSPSISIPSAFESIVVENDPANIVKAIEKIKERLTHPLVKFATKNVANFSLDFIVQDYIHSASNGFSAVAYTHDQFTGEYDPEIYWLPNKPCSELVTGLSEPLTMTKWHKGYTEILEALKAIVEEFKAPQQVEMIYTNSLYILQTRDTRIVENPQPPYFNADEVAVGRLMSIFGKPNMYLSVSWEEFIELQESLKLRRDILYILPSYIPASHYVELAKNQGISTGVFESKVDESKPLTYSGRYITQLK